METGSNQNSHRTGFTKFDFPNSAIARQLRRSKPAKPLPLPPEATLSFRKKVLSGAITKEAAQLQLAVRRDQKTLTADEKAHFKNAVQKIVDDGTYADLVSIHADMKHMMHGSMGKLGLLRFLPWHRRYILEFERMLVAADKALRPGVGDVLTLPYWHWADPFPAWLDKFLPAKLPNGNSKPPARTEKAPPPKPTQTDIDYILRKFRDQKQWFNVDDDFALFTFGLEGWGKRPDGSDLPAHNHVHDWVGGIMADTSFSPVDPVFWLHHAEVDRLWHLWQVEHLAAHPNLKGKSATMDPWAETSPQLQVIETLGYTYF